MQVNNSNSNLTKYAQELRKNMTKEERHLWYDFLKNCGYRFKRQKIIGNYIVDFCCDNPKIVIELDGNQHKENQKVVLSDEQRDFILEKKGYRVLRYSNPEIKTNFSGVCENILMKLENTDNGTAK